VNKKIIIFSIDSLGIRHLQMSLLSAAVFIVIGLKICLTQNIFFLMVNLIIPSYPLLILYDSDIKIKKQRYSRDYLLSIEKSIRDCVHYIHPAPICYISYIIYIYIYIYIHIYMMCISNMSIKYKIYETILQNYRNYSSII